MNERSLINLLISTLVEIRSYLIFQFWIDLLRGCSCCLQENTSVPVPLTRNDLGGGAGGVLVVVVVMDVIISLVHGDIQ